MTTTEVVMKTQTYAPTHQAVRRVFSDLSGRRSVLNIALAVALFACSQAARADKIIVTWNGTPASSGSQLPKGATNIRHPGVVKVDGEDLYFDVWTFDVPPPPAPQTYRVVSPGGKVTVIGDGTNGKPKQVGNSVVLTYSDGETVEFKGTLLKPGDPDPAPAPSQGGAMNGRGGFLPPATALADVEKLLQQPDLAYIFTSPIDLSYFQYDFNGSADMPIFLGGYTVNYVDGTVDSMQIVPEPASLLLLGSGVVGLSGLLRKRLLTRT
jgi:hypothetical protein